MRAARFDSATRRLTVEDVEVARSVERLMNKEGNPIRLVVRP